MTISCVYTVQNTEVCSVVECIGPQIFLNACLSDFELVITLSLVLKIQLVVYLTLVVKLLVVVKLTLIKSLTLVDILTLNLIATLILVHFFLVFDSISSPTLKRNLDRARPIQNAFSPP